MELRGKKVSTCYLVLNVWQIDVTDEEVLNLLFQIKLLSLDSLLQEKWLYRQHWRRPGPKFLCRILSLPLIVALVLSQR